MGGGFKPGTMGQAQAQAQAQGGRKDSSETLPGTLARGVSMPYAPGMTTTKGAQGMTCATCGKAMDPLEAFPGAVCLDCWAETDEGRRMPTADELTAMWGGPVLRTITFDDEGAQA